MENAREYGPEHIHFLQYMLEKGCINMETAITLCNGVLSTEMVEFSEPQVKTFIQVINRKIKHQDLKLIVTQCEVTGDTVVVLIVTIADEVSKFQNTYTAVELKYFHLILFEIVTTELRKLEHIYCLNLASSVTPTLDYSTAEHLLTKWISTGYLVSSNGFVHFGPRCIAEFTSFFRTECTDYVHVCSLCSELVFNGVSCSACNKLLHENCMEIFLRNQSKCPSCRKSWVPTVNQTTAHNNSAEGSDSEMSTD